MASTKELRRRIKSIKNTSQITRAMQMVSATKMRRAQNQALSSRPYDVAVSCMLSKLVGQVDSGLHPLLSQNGLGNKIGIILLSSDKGLCGALNANLFRLITRLESEEFKGKELTFYAFGKKGRDFVVRTSKKLEADFESMEQITVSSAIKIKNFVIQAYLKGEVNAVYLLYPHFISTLTQEVKLVKILPIDSSSLVDSSLVASSSELLFEPSADIVLDFALTHLVETKIYQSLLEAKASEHSARMVAMKNATDSASDLVADLTLTYNQVRQELVTRELLEITSAGAALE